MFLLATYTFALGLGIVIVRFTGLEEEYKGEIDLDPAAQRLVFSGNNERVHEYFDGIRVNQSTYIQIIVQNRKGEVIEDIHVKGNSSMQDTIKNYNLSNGIEYEYGYMIIFKMIEPRRTLFLMDDNNELKHFNGTPNNNFHTHAFKIVDDRLISIPYYEEKYIKLLLDWNAWFQQLVKEMKRQLRDYVPKLEPQQKRAWKDNFRQKFLNLLHFLKQNIHIISSGAEMHALRTKVERLRPDIDRGFHDVFKMLDDVNSKLIEETKPGACSSTMGVISPPSLLIPGVGLIMAAVTDIIEANCAIAGV